MGMLVAIARTASSSKVGKWAVKNAPQILLGTGFLSGAGALVGVGYATKKSIEEIELEKMRRAIEQGLSKDEIKLTKKEVVKLVGKNYIVPGLMAAGAAGASIAAFKVEHGRALSLAAMLGATESRLASMEAEMIEQLGDKKFKEIKDTVAQKEIEKAKVGEPDSPLFDVGGSGEYWILDPVTKLEFRGTRDKISLAIANCDHQLELAAENGIDDEKVSVFDFLSEFDIDPWKIPTAARNLVWRSGETTNIGVHVGTGMTSKGEPCYVLNYESIVPKWDSLWNISAY